MVLLRMPTRSEIADDYTLQSQPPRPRKVFITPPTAPNFIDRETELEQLEAWFEREGEPVSVIGAIGGQGKTYLAARFVEGLRQSERAVQIRWVECDENLKVKDLLHDFANEMEGHNIAEARVVRDCEKPLRARLDALVRYLERASDRWLLVLDDFHKLKEDKDNWDEFVRFIDQRCRRTKMLIVTRREPEALDEPKLPIGAHEELRLPELPKEMAKTYLGLLGLEVDGETAEQIWEKCSGSPLAMKLFSQAAKRRSVEAVLSLPLPQWSDKAQAWLDELQRDLSDEAKEAAKRLAFSRFFIIQFYQNPFISLDDIRPVERELLLAMGATEEGLDELDRAYLLNRDEEGFLQLHDLLWDYWIDKVLQEAIDELGEDFRSKFQEKIQKQKGFPFDLMREVILRGETKVSKWVDSAVEFLQKQAYRLAKEGDFTGAEELLEHAALDLVAHPPFEPFRIDIYAEGLLSLGDIALEQGDKKVAEHFYRESIEACEVFWDDWDELHSTLLKALQRLAKLRWQQGRLKESQLKKIEHLLQEPFLQEPFEDEGERLKVLGRIVAAVKKLLLA